MSTEEDIHISNEGWVTEGGSSAHHKASGQQQPSNHKRKRADTQSMETRPIIARSSEYESESYPDYLIHIEIPHTKSLNISRTLSVPVLTTFHTLHLAIQIAFGWTFEHAYQFDVIKSPSATVYKPAAPRRSSYNSNNVNISIRWKTQWNSDEFDQPPLPAELRAIIRPEEELIKDTKVTRLIDIFPSAVVMATSATRYLYDFGDNWELKVTCLGQAFTTSKTPICISGVGRGPGEDVGGVCVWEGIKESYAASNPEAEHEEAIRFFEDGCDPQGMRKNEHWVWDMKDVNKKLKRLPKRPGNFVLK